MGTCRNLGHLGNKVRTQSVFAGRDVHPLLRNAKSDSIQQQQQQQQHISNNTAKVGRDPDQPKEMNQSADPEYKMQAQTFHVTQKSRRKGPVDPKQEDQNMQLSQNSKCKMQKTISFQTSKSDDPRQQHNAKIKLIP